MISWQKSHQDSAKPVLMRHTRAHIDPMARTDGGDSSNYLAKLQLVQDRSLSRCIEPDHENTAFRLAEEDALK